jgi:hypothetical protein
MSSLLAGFAKSIKPPNHKISPTRTIVAALIVAVGIGFIAFAFGGKDAAQQDYRGLKGLLAVPPKGM